jgi:hypothetical protein
MGKKVGTMIPDPRIPVWRRWDSEKAGTITNNEKVFLHTSKIQARLKAFTKSSIQDFCMQYNDER